MLFSMTDSKFKFFPFQVLVTNLELEPVAHLEPANFWIGPSVVRPTIYLHLVLNIESPTIHLFR